MRFAVVLGLLAGCVRADLVPCGDKQCAADQVCLAMTCVDRDRVAACEGLADGAACGDMGRCTGGACVDVACGDGVVDPGEDCDGTPIGSCLDVGFDTGTPSCSSACRIDPTTGCVRFGWRQVVNAPTDRLWTDGSTMVYTTDLPDALEIHTPTSTRVEPGAWALLAGNATRVFAATDTTLYEIVGTDLVALPAPPTTNPRITSLAVGADGTLYAHTVATCGLWMRAPATEWTEVAFSSALLCATSVAVITEAGTERAYAISQGRELYELSGGSLELRYSHGSPFNALVGDADGMWIAADDGLYRRAQGAAVRVRPGAFTSIARVGDHVYAAGPGGTITRASASGRYNVLEAPTEGEVYSDGSTLFVYGGPIHAFTGIDFTALSALPVTMGTLVDVARLSTGTTVVASEQVIFTATATGWDSMFNPGAPAAIGALAAGGGRRVLATDNGGLNPFVFQWMEGSQTWTQIVGAAPIIDGLFVRADGTIVAVGQALGDPSRAAFAIRGGADWDVVEHTEIGCHADAVHENANGRLVAAGACNTSGVIWEHDNAGWTEIYRGPHPFSAVLVTTAGEIFATGDTGTVRGDGTTWIPDDAVHGRSLSGDDNDVWVAGYFTNVQKFDGTSWAQVTTRALTTMLVSVGDDDITFPGAASGHIRLVRDH